MRSDALDPLGLPSPVPAKHGRARAAAIWIVPLVALAIAAVVGVRALLAIGPTVAITFESAEGLEAGTSEVRFRNVPVGKVEHVEISHDHAHVVAIVRLERDAASLAAKDSRFWVERPRIGVGGVSGLGTVLTGAFIGVDAGASSERAESFVGLEKPPGVTRADRGTTFRVSAPDAGSLAVASPVYYKRVAVGFTSNLELAADGKQVSIDVFVRDPYAKLVTTSTVFWNASGLDMTIDASGLRLDTQSLATVVAGGIAFGERDGATPGAPAAASTVFPLYGDRSHAMTPPDGLKVMVAMRFVDATRGVVVGTPLDFRGLTIGNVDAIEPGYDPRSRRFYTDVRATVYPERLDDAYEQFVASGKVGPDMVRALVADYGMHAQIKSANMLTGSAYVALALVPPAHGGVVAAVAKGGAIAIPTAPGGVDQLQDKLAAILDKIDRIPFATIGDEVAKTVGALRTNIAASDSSLQESVRATMRQLENAARSVRTLTDYLARHPESILRGRK